MKRPKVRYVALPGKYDGGLHTCPAVVPKDGGAALVRDCYPASAVHRIAAALNLHEAVRRGELKVVDPDHG